ncbi:MAG TPA: hypothetical protein ENK81_02420 [Euryarchaeota archaeon]|nr:hypothetical protein [Euryarchaeota archaeon]
MNEVSVTNCVKHGVQKADYSKMTDEQVVVYALDIHVSIESRSLIVELIRRWENDKFGTKN